VVAVLVSLCALALTVGRAGAAKGVRFGIQDDAWLEIGPGRLSDRVAKLDRLGLDVVRVTLSWPARGAARRRAASPRPAPRRHDLGDARLGERRQRAERRSAAGSRFQRFVQTAARRYPFVTHWIMWNEPNKATWLKPASPRTYVTRILNPGYGGLNAVDRRDKVAGGVTGRIGRAASRRSTAAPSPRSTRRCSRSRRSAGTAIG